MGAEPGAFARRVYVPDAANDEFFLRVTHHAPERLFVVSTWQHDVCTAAVRVPVEAAPELIALLANGLGAAAAVPVPPPTAPAPPARRWWDRALAALPGRRPLATVLPLRPRR
jgi:hypothetical protein